MNKKQKKMTGRIIAAAILLAIVYMAPLTGWVQFGAYLVPYGIVGYDILYKACKGICNRQVFDENFLMAVASVGALVIAVYQHGDYTEAIAVMLLYQVGELFQSYAVGKSRRNISALMDIRPDYANIEQEDGTLEQVDPDEVEIGTMLVVRPGEKVPIDGVVISGQSTLNTSALTGESVPRDVCAGEEIISGCINMTSVLKIRTTKPFEESTVAKILDLVENASSLKSKSERFISKFARVYTPVVCYSALALAVVPPLVRMCFLQTAPLWDDWIYRALTFLIISCPCALVISVPLSFFAGIGGASRAGILIKGANFLETLAKAAYVVFDKTGTLTEGVFDVAAVHYSSMDREKLLAYAALAESRSTHPISKSLQKAYGKKTDSTKVTNIQEMSGKGVIAEVDGVFVAAGNEKLMEELHVPYKRCHQSGTIVHMAVSGAYAGHIVIADTVKPTARQAVSLLRTHGIQKTVMLTGDTAAAAQEAAQHIGIDEVWSELLPADKVEKVEQLLKQKPKNSSLVFVGDGINDAPVLSRADIGIAMGAMGSDAAIEAADVVLMDDDPLKVAAAIQIARKCMGIVKENIVFAIGIKIVCLFLGAIGIANMWLAIFADVGVTVLAVLNAMRALFTASCVPQKAACAAERVTIRKMG